MPRYFGIDTSNYTTSVALFDSETHEVFMEKKLLPTKEGSLGLRQSDAVFSHVKQLGELVHSLMDGRAGPFCAVGVSAFPRRAEGSYMPCFLVGEMAAQMLGAVNHVPVYQFSHQEGHLAAALYSAKKLSLLKGRFLAFHLSGGTTDALLVEPGRPFFSVTPVAKTLDLKAGQLVDRVGLMLGCKFPCGPELESLALQWEEPIQIKPTMKGADCCLSGVENRCRALLDEGKPFAFIARYCLEAVQAALSAMTEALLHQYKNLPLLYAGGVMSNSLIRNAIEKKYGGFFAEPRFSSDNSAGVALLAALSEGFEPED